MRLPIVDKQLVMANLGEGEGEMGDWGQAFLSANGAGTGAYRVVSHNPQEETVMEKSADYFLPHRRGGAGYRAASLRAGGRPRCAP